VKIDEVEILLVEDSLMDIELMIHVLRSEKLSNKIYVVRDGEEVLDFLFCRGAYSDRFLDQLPRVMILDLKLPKIDGLQVLRIIKSDPRTQAIPVIVLTSSKEDRDLVESYQLGVNSYIQKPMDFGQFRETIKYLGLYWVVVNQPMPSNIFSGTDKRPT
jgi:CheY-like chemotaxis protein